MAETGTDLILAGNHLRLTEAMLELLRIDPPSSPSPADPANRICHVSEAAEALGSDGFEGLLEWEFDLQLLATDFEALGLPEAAEIVLEVLGLIPDELRGEEQYDSLVAFLGTQYHELKGPLDRYYDASMNLASRLAVYIIANQNHLARWLSVPVPTLPSDRRDDIFGKVPEWN